MQVSKISAVVCVLALGCTASLQAADNPAQAAARAAIASKLFEISSVPATNKADATKTEKAVVAPNLAPAAVVAKPVVITPAPVATPSTEPAMKPILTSTEAKAKAKKEADAKAAEAKVVKEAAMKAEAQQAAAMATAKKLAKADAEKAAAEAKTKKLAEAKAAEQKAAEIAAAKKQAKASTTQAKAQPAVQPKVEAAKTTVTTKDTPAQAQAREALARSLFDSSSTASTAAKPATPSTPAAATSSAPKAVVAMPVVSAAPPLPINVSKQQQLSALLAKYKADQVTPEEYQKQRAAILAQP